MLPTGIQKVGVVGTGAVGAGLAQVCLQSGLEVLLVDATEESLGFAESLIIRGLHRAEQPGAFSLLRKSTRLEPLGDCDFVVECASEAPEAKQDLLCRIDARLMRPNVIGVQLAAITLGMAARTVENPDRVVGLHLLPPVHITGVAEVVRGEHSSEEAVRTAIGFVERLGKKAVRCKDTPGFVINRLLRPFFREALRLLERGRGTPGTVDAALKNLGCLRAGPFETLDMLGLDRDLSVAATVYELLGRPQRLEPSRIQEELVDRGSTGRLAGKGFYVYGDEEPGTENPLLGQLVSGFGGDPAPPPDVLREVMEGVFAEARALADAGAVEPGDADAAMRMSLGWPKGPYEWQKEWKR